MPVVVMHHVMVVHVMVHHVVMMMHRPRGGRAGHGQGRCGGHDSQDHFHQRFLPRGMRDLKPIPAASRRAMAGAPQVDWVLSGRPRMRLEMMLFWISADPP